jgi:hypothetical protein
VPENLVGSKVKILASFDLGTLNPGGKPLTAKPLEMELKK